MDLYKNMRNWDYKSKNKKVVRNVDEGIVKDKVQKVGARGGKMDS